MQTCIKSLSPGYENAQLYHTLLNHKVAVIRLSLSFTSSVWLDTFVHMGFKVSETVTPAVLNVLRIKKAVYHCVVLNFILYLVSVRLAHCVSSRILKLIYSFSITQRHTKCEKSTLKKYYCTPDYVSDNNLSYLLSRVTVTIWSTEAMSSGIFLEI